MMYSIGQCLSEYGFSFYEPLHSPILLLNEAGKVLKMNRAARKFISLSKIGKAEIEKRFSTHLKSSREKIMVVSKQKKLHLVVSKLINSDYFLVEMKRS